MSEVEITEQADGGTIIIVPPEGSAPDAAEEIAHPMVEAAAIDAERDIAIAEIQADTAVELAEIIHDETETVTWQNVMNAVNSSSETMLAGMAAIRADLTSILSILTPPLTEPPPEEVPLTPPETSPDAAPDAREAPETNPAPARHRYRRL